jgi:tRNA uridine 5-carbamoylmethylation protein Kti12
MSETIFNQGFLDDVEKFTSKSFHQKDDLMNIIDSFNRTSSFKDFENFAFLGKYVNGLFRVIQSSGKVTEFQNLEQVKKDLGENIEKVISSLKEITLKLNEEHKIKLEKKYLELSKESIQNIQHLVEDLDDIKKYLNFIKRK